MKKTLMLAGALSLLTIYSFAQPTLKQSTNSPVPGEGFFGHIIDSTGLGDAQQAGAGVTWNFPVLTENSRDTNYYYSCEATPFCDSFAGANIVSLIDSNFEYGVSESNRLSFMGWASSNGVNHFDGRQVLLAYPFTYGDSYKDTLSIVDSYPGVYYDSIFVIDSFFADGYGTLILPSGTFTNVLRIHRVSLQLDSFRYDGADSGSIYGRMDDYSWFDTTGFHNPLLSVGYDTSGSTTPYIYNAEYYTQAPPLALGLPAPGVNDISLSVYPNPANGVINVTFLRSDNEPLSVSLVDMLGRVIKTTTLDQLSEGASTVTLDVASVCPGMYIVKFQTAQDIFTRPVVVAR